jgi:acyl transferase domain-containing protein
MVHDGEHVQYPGTWWEKHTNFKTAKRWLDDTEAMINEIHNATDNSEFPAFGILSIGSNFGKIVE